MLNFREEFEKLKNEKASELSVSKKVEEIKEFILKKLGEIDSKTFLETENIVIKRKYPGLNISFNSGASSKLEWDFQECDGIERILLCFLATELKKQGAKVEGDPGDIIIIKVNL